MVPRCVYGDGGNLLRLVESFKQSKWRGAKFLPCCFGDVFDVSRCSLVVELFFGCGPLTDAVGGIQEQRVWHGVAEQIEAVQAPDDVLRRALHFN